MSTEHVVGDSGDGIGVAQFKEEISRISNEALELTRRLQDLGSKAELSARSNVLLKSYGNEDPSRRLRRTSPGTGKEIPERDFAMQNSVLTDLFQSKHLSTIQNILIGAAIFWAMSTAIYDYYERQSLSDILPSIGLMERSFLNGRLAIKEWLKLNLATLTIYPLALIWYMLRPSNQPTVTWFDRIFLVGYASFQVGFLSLPFRLLFVEPILGPAAAFSFCIEQIRLMMKIHSFTREIGRCHLRAIAASLSKKTEDGNRINSDNPVTTFWKFPTIKQFIYFLFAPTLIYRDEYPRTATIRWGFVLSNFAQFVGSMICQYALLDRYLMAELKVYQPETVTFEMMLKSWIRCAIPGTATQLLAFFGFFHSWLNMWAELLRFGDRVFYKDWWTCTDYGSYWRQWNCVVHDWLHTYIYKEFHDSLKIGKIKTLATFFAFFVSSVFHEYILTATLKFFYPIMFLYLGCLGFFVTLFRMTSSSRLSNVFLWWCTLVCMGLMFCLYAFETTARTICPPVYKDNWFLDGLTPRFYNCWGKKL